MNFHAEFTPKSFPVRINHRQKILLLGSCFTEQIGQKLSRHKFNTLENPNGILFNPVSIARAITSYLQVKKYRKDDLFYYNELWGSWDHHTRFSSINPDEALDRINNSQDEAHIFIQSTDWLMLTLGSAFVYENKSDEVSGTYDRVVANCHKIPADTFNRRLLAPEEIIALLKRMVEDIRAVNPGVSIVFTISPVRHLREGFVENNRSKAALIQAVHSLTNATDTFYFPAYELVMDDLRDYRFYAEDMVHPNYAATNYVWEKFVETAIDDSSRLIMKEINTINAARHHRPFNPDSAAHKLFLQAHYEKTRVLHEAHPYLDLAKELIYFKGE